MPLTGLARISFLDLSPELRGSLAHRPERRRFSQCLLTRPDGFFVRNDRCVPGHFRCGDGQDLTLNPRGGHEQYKAGRASLDGFWRDTFALSVAQGKDRSRDARRCAVEVSPGSDQDTTSPVARHGE